MQLERDLLWDGCLNVRDLGGHPTEDGAETRFGAVVRADSVRKLSEAGWRDLVAYGVGRIVDLRFHEELAADPPEELPVEVVHVPVFPEPDDPLWARIDARADRGREYLDLLEHGRGAFAEAVRAVADAPEGGVLVHCFAGKDRTGLVAALLLRLAGVGVGDVATDYAVSERRLAPLFEPWIAEAEDERERARREYLRATPKQAMELVLHELERVHGSVEGYLRAGGAGADELERARARLRA